MKANSLRQIFDNRKETGAVLTKAAGAYRIDPSLFMVEENFNTRDYSHQDVQNHIDTFVDIIKDGGDLGLFKVTVKDGKIWLREGHCRNMAIKKAKKLGINAKPVLVEELTPDEESCSEIVILTTNNGLKLKPLERAATYAKIIAKGRDPKYIAKLEGISEVAVRNLLRAHNLPDELKEHIRKDRISFTSAIEQYKEHGDDLIEMIRGKLSDESSSSEDQTKTDEQVSIFEVIAHKRPQDKQVVTPTTSESESWDLIGTLPTSPAESADIDNVVANTTPNTRQPESAKKVANKVSARLTARDFGSKTIKGDQAKQVVQIINNLVSKIEEAAVGEEIDPDSLTLTLDKEFVESILVIARKIKG